MAYLGKATGSEAVELHSVSVVRAEAFEAMIAEVEAPALTEAK